MFGDSLLTGRPGNFNNRTDYFLINFIVNNIADKGTIDLNKIHRQCFQITVLAIASTKIIQCKFTASVSQLFYPLAGGTHGTHSNLFRNFQNDRIKG